MPRPLLLLIVLCVGATARSEDVQGLVIPFKQVSVASPVLQEVVDAVLVEEGDSVKEGQAIVQLRAERESLQVEQDKKLVEQKDFVAKGAAALLKEKMMSREAVLEKETDLELAKIRLRASEYALKEKTIRSPINGIVVKKYKEPGESVDRVEKLVDVVSLDQVYVQFYLDPKLMTSVKVDQVIFVRFPVIGDQKFEARVSFVDPRIDAGSGLFRVKLLVENSNRVIKPGMRGTADFGSLTAAR